MWDWVKKKQNQTKGLSLRSSLCALWEPLSMGCAVTIGVFIVATGLPGPMEETTLHVPFMAPSLLHSHSFRRVNLCVRVEPIFSPTTLKPSKKVHEGRFPTNKPLLRKAPQPKHSVCDPIVFM